MLVFALMGVVPGFAMSTLVALGSEECTEVANIDVAIRCAASQHGRLRQPKVRDTHIQKAAAEGATVARPPARALSRQPLKPGCGAGIRLQC